jgi:hypothetical protein
MSVPGVPGLIGETGPAGAAGLQGSSGGVFAGEDLFEEYQPNSPPGDTRAYITNKRFINRVGSTTSSATPTINTDTYDIYKLTAQTVDITSFTTNLSGSPIDGDCLVIEITGTAARAITWGTSFEASTVALPVTTTGTNLLTVGFMWNTATSKWRCIGAV